MDLLQNTFSGRENCILLNNFQKMIVIIAWIHEAFENQTEERNFVWFDVCSLSCAISYMEQLCAIERLQPSAFTYLGYVCFWSLVLGTWDICIYIYSFWDVIHGISFHIITRMVSDQIRWYHIMAYGLMWYEMVSYELISCIIENKVMDLGEVSSASSTSEIQCRNILVYMCKKS